VASKLGFLPKRISKDLEEEQLDDIDQVKKRE